MSVHTSFSYTQVIAWCSSPETISVTEHAVFCSGTTSSQTPRGSQTQQTMITAVKGTLDFLQWGLNL